MSRAFSTTNSMADRIKEAILANHFRDSAPFVMLCQTIWFRNGVKCVIQRRGARGLWLSKAIPESTKTTVASKQKFSNRRALSTWPGDKGQYVPQLVHQSEIIGLLRSTAVQVAKQIHDIITQTKGKLALHLGHAYMCAQAFKGNIQAWPWKQSQSSPTSSFPVVSQSVLILQKIC